MQFYYSTISFLLRLVPVLIGIQIRYSADYSTTPLLAHLNIIRHKYQMDGPSAHTRDLPDITFGLEFR